LQEDQANWKLSPLWWSWKLQRSDWFWSNFSL